MPQLPTQQEKKIVKHKRPYEVSDMNALYTAYPQFFKLVPDYAKINSALKIGLFLPGLSPIGVDTEYTSLPHDPNAPLPIDNADDEELFVTN